MSVYTTDSCQCFWNKINSKLNPLPLVTACLSDFFAMPPLRWNFCEDLLHFALCVSGEVYYAPVSYQMTFQEANKECKRRNAVLASPGQLHAAWRLGLDRCDYGWLSDGSARHPVAVPRMQCGGGLLGVRTMYRYRNQTGFPEPTTKLGAYCFKGKSTHRVLLLVFAIFMHMMGNMVYMFIILFSLIGGHRLFLLK